MDVWTDKYPVFFEAAAKKSKQDSDQPTEGPMDRPTNSPNDEQMSHLAGE